MFTKFATMLGEGDSLNITITKAGDRLITSIIPKKSGLKDDAAERIVPMVISGTPEELENGFIGAIHEPIQKVTGILSNMRSFEKSADEAMANSKTVKANIEKTKKETEEKKKKFDQLSKKADELEKDKKYLNAIACLRQSKEFATNKSAVEGRIQKLEKLSGQNSIFREMDIEEPIVDNYLEDSESTIQDVDFEDNEETNNEEE